MWCYISSIIAYLHKSATNYKKKFFASACHQEYLRWRFWNYATEPFPTYRFSITKQCCLFFSRNSCWIFSYFQVPTNLLLISCTGMFLKSDCYAVCSQVSLVGQVFYEPGITLLLDIRLSSVHHFTKVKNVLYILFLLLEQKDQIEIVNIRDCY